METTNKTSTQTSQIFNFQGLYKSFTDLVEKVYFCMRYGFDLTDDSKMSTTARNIFMCPKTVTFQQANECIEHYSSTSNRLVKNLRDTLVDLTLTLDPRAKKFPSEEIGKMIIREASIPENEEKVDKLFDVLQNRLNYERESFSGNEEDLPTSKVLKNINDKLQNDQQAKNDLLTWEQWCHINQIF